ncbi:MAG: hypothetical protein QOH66_224 [Actinomycetota bacterium]|nr:hypothetical protein [Actinomycetota bacterium]
MSRKQQRRRRRPGARLHRGKAGTPRMDDDIALWAVHLLTHVLASEAYSMEEAAELVVEFPTTFPPLMVPVVVGQSCLRRVVDIAAAALRRAPASRNALAFAAQVATAEGDHTRASLLMEEAWSAGEPDSGLRQTWAAVLVAAGGVAGAIPEIDALCVDYPNYFVPQALRAETLTLLERRVAGPADGACTCGSGLPYAGCCRGTELDALRRFGDRADLEDLIRKLHAHLAGLDGFLSVAGEEWLRAHRQWWGGDYSLSESDLVLSALWGAEVIVPAPGTAARWAVSAGQRTLLEDFAALPEVRERHGKLMDAWVRSARFGTWQVDPDQRGPGLILSDLLTGLKIYAAVEPHVRDDIADPWSVLVGTMVPDGGIWRSLPGLVVLSPAEADILVGRVHRLASVLVECGPGDAARPSFEVIPPSMLPGMGPPPPPEVARVMADTANGMLPELLAEARLDRMSQLNADDEVVVHVQARVTADDGGALWASLMERDDIHLGPGDELLWSGRSLDATDRRRTALRLPDRGFVAGRATHAHEGDGVLVKAMVRMEKGCLVIWANSMERVDGILAVIREIEPLAVVARSAASTGAAPAPWADPKGTSAQAAALWEQEWPDQAVFALDCRTPREAAESIDNQPRLELVLRELEFHAARVRRQGRPAPDMAAVRERLGMKLPPMASMLGTAV